METLRLFRVNVDHREGITELWSARGSSVWRGATCQLGYGEDGIWDACLPKVLGKEDGEMFVSLEWGMGGGGGRRGNVVNCWNGGVLGGF